MPGWGEGRPYYTFGYRSLRNKKRANCTKKAMAAADKEAKKVPNDMPAVADALLAALSKAEARLVAATDAEVVLVGVPGSMMVARNQGTRLS